MLKKLLMLCAALILSLSAGFAAAVEVNSADQSALESVKGIGPVHAKAIIDERTKNGPFKDANDLASRVKGLGTKSVGNLEAAGLTINGSSSAPAGAKSTAKPMSPAATKPMAAAPAMAMASAPSGASGGAMSMSKSMKQSKGAASAPAMAMAAASTPAASSGAMAPMSKKTKKTKMDKAASAAAASGK